MHEPRSVTKMAEWKGAVCQLALDPSRGELLLPTACLTSPLASPLFSLARLKLAHVAISQVSYSSAKLCELFDQSRIHLLSSQLDPPHPPPHSRSHLSLSRLTLILLLPLDQPSCILLESFLKDEQVSKRLRIRGGKEGLRRRVPRQDRGVVRPWTRAARRYGRALAARRVARWRSCHG